MSCPTLGYYPCAIRVVYETHTHKGKEYEDSIPTLPLEITWSQIKKLITTIRWRARKEIPCPHVKPVEKVS